MYNSFDHYSDFPQQNPNFLPNLHDSSSTCNLTYQEMNPFHQYQMGSFHYPPNVPCDEFSYNEALLGQPCPKKDPHQKISTAQGVRGRRVRLSMAIAREFFDLQDMLGFDKASKTIEWLLAKSRGAIQELTLKKLGLGSGLASSSSNSSSMTLASRRGSSSACKSRGGGKGSQVEIENQVNYSVARENRAKARARARERTRVKLSLMPKSTQVEGLGLQTRHNEECNGLNVINSQDSSDRSDPFDLLWASNYNPNASTMCSSFFESEHLHFS